MTFPALGDGRVTRPEITIRPRRMSSMLPVAFDDLRVSPRSPDGTTRTFWLRFRCDVSGIVGDCLFQVTNVVRASTTPAIVVEATHRDVSQLHIELIGADGSEAVVWNRGAGPLPASIPLSTMTGAWMTGRYQIEVTDPVEGTTGALTRWCIHAN